MNRKEFTESLVRGAFLGILALLSGILLARRQVSTRKECGLEIACRNCGKKTNCTYVDESEG